MSELIKVCGVPDHLGVGQVCKWPDGKVGVSLHGRLPAISDDEFLGCIRWACTQVNAVCGAFLFVAEVPGRVRVFVKRLDGPNGVLAQSELPCGPVTVCRQDYDDSERWSSAGPPWAPGMVPLRLTFLHELLHALGVSHAPAGMTAVMAPILNTALTTLQPWDKEQLVLRYGPKRATPPPDPRPDPVPDPNPEVPKMGWLEMLAKVIALLGDPNIRAIIAALVELLARGRNVTDDDVKKLAFELRVVATNLESEDTQAAVVEAVRSL